MRNLLICTIARDAAWHLNTWYSQILSLTSLLKTRGYEVYLSVAENDSGDGTAEWVADLPDNACSLTDRIVVSTEELGTQKYPSVWNPDRLRNLAVARQKCLDQAAARWGLDHFQKIAYIEPDVTYDPMWCYELVVANHPRAAGLPEPDVYSGWSLRSLAHPKESTFLYDTCATRQTMTDTCWNHEKEHAWRGQSVVPTHLSHFDSNCLHRVWSTFNCFCVYNVKPFIGGETEHGGYCSPVRWDYVNRRLDNGQQRVENQSGFRGYLEADTVAICEDFRARGYNGIYLNTNCLIRHA